MGGCFLRSLCFCDLYVLIEHVLMLQKRFSGEFEIFFVYFATFFRFRDFRTKNVVLSVACDFLTLTPVTLL